MIKVIKTKSDYDTALSDIEALIDRDPDEGTPDAEKLELLTLLVQSYETSLYPRRSVDPIDALLFRMEQQGLTPRDLVPYLGSRSRVSEILSRKRPLTLQMIRSLHKGLGIPAQVLIARGAEDDPSEPSLQWTRFPLREMAKRGWLDASPEEVQKHPEAVARTFFSELPYVASSVAVLYRRTDHIRSQGTVDRYALVAWTARVMMLAAQRDLSATFRPGSVDLEFLRSVAKLSWSDSGPLLAREFLGKHGIALIVERQLPRCRLDGAAIMIEKTKPVVGMTLRHDRLDNFWFCLMHELAHISLDMDSDVDGFFDDLDAASRDDKRERAADALAGSALIPEEIWRKSPAKNLRSPEAVRDLAEELRIHPAIVAGRIRHEWNSFRVLGNFVGSGMVQKLFPEVDWS